MALPSGLSYALRFTSARFHHAWHLLQVYVEATVLIAKRVTGEEEVPEGVVAVLTPDAPDVLSHVSVRARNMKVCLTPPPPPPSSQPLHTV